MTTSPAPAYCSAHAFTYGWTWMQLMQAKVQNSTRTGRPRSPAIVWGWLLIQAVIPVNSGAGPRSSSATGPGSVVAIGAGRPVREASAAVRTRGVGRCGASSAQSRQLALDSEVLTGQHEHRERQHQAAEDLSSALPDPGRRRPDRAPPAGDDGERHGDPEHVAEGDQQTLVVGPPTAAAAIAPAMIGPAQGPRRGRSRPRSPGPRPARRVCPRRPPHAHVGHRSKRSPSPAVILGTMIDSPTNPRRTALASRSGPVVTPAADKIAANRIVTARKLAAKPMTIPADRRRPPVVAEPITSTTTGAMHGARTVRAPASTAAGKSSNSDGIGTSRDHCTRP